VVLASEVVLVVLALEVQEWEAQEVDMGLEPAAEREMVAALRKGRIVPRVESAAEVAAQAVGPFLM